MYSYSPQIVGQLLGVSTDTVRRWCDEGRLQWANYEGPRRVDGVHLAAYLRAHASVPGALDASVAHTSARNHFVGIVTHVERDKVMAQVEIAAPPHRIVSLISREAADELDLHPGALATASVKATNVTLGRPQ